MQADMKDKASIEETMRIWHNFSNFAEYKELQALYNKVLPEMDKHQNHMNEHNSEIARFAEVLTRFDEVISEKAPRQDMRALEKWVRDDYMTVSGLQLIEDEANGKISKLSERQEKLETSLELLSKQISVDIYSAFKKMQLGAQGANTRSASMGAEVEQKLQ